MSNWPIRWNIPYSASEETREKQASAARKHLGIPNGYHRLYGALVRDEIFEATKKQAAQIRNAKGKDSVKAEMPGIIERVIQQRKFFKLIGFEGGDPD